MNKKIISKTKLISAIFLVVLVSSFGFFIFPRDAKADATISVYNLITPDPTPLIRGNVGEPGVDVYVVIIGYVDATVTALGDGSWSYQLEDEEALPAPGDYAVGVAANIEGIISNSAFIYVDEEYPIALYYNDSTIIFPNEYTYTSAEGHFSITFAAETEITRTDEENFGDDWTWYIEGVEPNNERVLLKLRFGIPNIDLTFSKNITIVFDVGEEYDGQILHIFFRSDGGGDGWEPMDVDCTVEAGSCSFEIDHASYFAITQYNSIAETEEGENDEENDEADKAHIDSWKAYRYEDANKNCSSRLKLTIKGKHFDKNAKVEIGNHEASSVNKKSSRKLVAKFCLEKIWNDKANQKKTIKVTNPDADTEKADKKINLSDVGYDLSEEDYNPQTFEGIQNIQRALAAQGFLDEQYITGFYGPLTIEAVRKFQEQNGLPTTGFVGPLTKAKLINK